MQGYITIDDKKILVSVRSAQNGIDYDVRVCACGCDVILCDIPHDDVEIITE